MRAGLRAQLCCSRGSTNVAPSAAEQKTPVISSVALDPEGKFLAVVGVMIRGLAGRRARRAGNEH